jgi:hypothetical protein
MVLYNSPLAVGLLVAALVLVGVSALIGQARFSRELSLFERLASASGTPPASIPSSRIRRSVNSTILAVASILLFWLLLGIISFNDAFDVSPSFRPAAPVEWQRPTSPLLDVRFDRFEQPNSASRRERSGHS